MRKNYTNDTIEYERVVIALWSERLHANSICPLNHHLDYRNGWFYFDEDRPFQWPELTRKARALHQSGVTVRGRGLEYPEGFGEGDAYTAYQREEQRKAARRREEEQARKRQIDEINREFSGTERIMALEWAGYL
jgi:hypothetical protein